MSTLSVVIPSHNRNEILCQALHHLNTGSILPDEVIVVDDASNTPVRFTTEPKQYRFPLKIISFEQQRGAAAARNQGILTATSDLILLMDDDIWPDHEMIYYHKFLHNKHSQLGYGVLGRVIFHPELTRTPLLHFLEEHGAYRWMAKLQEGEIYSAGILTANVSLKRAFLRDDDLFDETFPYNRNEDTEFGLRLMNRGFEPRFHSGPSARHYAPMTMESYDRILAQSGYSKAYWAVKKPDDTNFCLMLEDLLQKSVQAEVFHKIYSEFITKLGDEFLNNDISNCSPAQIDSFCSVMEIAQVWLQDLGKIAGWREIVPGFELMAEDIKKGLAYKSKSESLDYLQSAFARNPEFFPAAILLAEHLQAFNKFEEAYQVLTPFRDSIWAKLKLGELNYYRGKYQDSLDLFLAVFDQTKHGKVIEQKQRQIAMKWVFKLLPKTKAQWMLQIWDNLLENEPKWNNEWVGGLASVARAVNSSPIKQDFEQRFATLRDLHQLLDKIETLNQTYSLHQPLTENLASNGRPPTYLKKGVVMSGQHLSLQAGSRSDLLRTLYHHLVPTNVRVHLRDLRLQIFSSLRPIYHRLIPVKMRLILRNVRLRLLGRSVSSSTTSALSRQQPVPGSSSVISTSAQPISKEQNGPPLARRLDAAYYAQRDPLTQKLMEKVRTGKNFYQVMQGFRGKDYDDRVIEYPYFVNWLLQQKPGLDILDVGCVLNNKLVSNILKEHCQQIWLANLVVEPHVYLQNPVYYHLSSLEDAFPYGQQFPLVTCLSTIEHIGYDNSQYGSKTPAKYTQPSIEPLLQSLCKLARLLAPGGQLLVSVPFGYRETLIHPATGKIFSQVFDFAAMQAGLVELQKAGVASELEVIAATKIGWGPVDPQTCTARYAENTPAAGAVAFITGRKS